MVLHDVHAGNPCAVQSGSVCGSVAPSSLQSKAIALASNSANPTRPESGSNAGRGFRYQDLVGALFVTRMYLGDVVFGAIVPEGSDDYEISGADGVILVDTKSNRLAARLRTRAEDATSLRKLWARPQKPGGNVAEFWLVTERGRSAGSAVAKVNSGELFEGCAPADAERSYIVEEPDPLRAAAELLVAQRGLTPVAAELTVIAFAREVGDLASENGPLDLEQRGAITPSDAERIASRVLTAVDADRLEALQRSGFVSAVDFVTPVEDSGFYLGVDVQPGHFVAGLAIDRPRAAAQIVAALEGSGAVVVRGPSGAGKSGLMWNSVLAARESRRWFRVHTSVEADANALTAFFEAYRGVSIGFVVDDIGRGGIRAWSELARRCATQSQAVILGSIRSEDAVLLPARHTIAELEIDPDHELARELWTRLHERGQTQWAGWSEPWDQSQGSLLEYGHILTVGARLDAVVLDQVRSRLGQNRDHELAVLGATALAAAHGGSLSISSLRDHLNLTIADMARALERLVAEHLIRVDEAGESLTGLHALRAASISSALSQIGYSTRAEQAKAAIAVTQVASLEKVIGGLIASGDVSADVAADAIAHKHNGDVALPSIAAAVRGLRRGALTLAVRDWLQALPAAGIPRKLATASAMMGVNDAAQMPDIGELRKLAAYGNRLFATVAEQIIPASLASTLIQGLRDSAGRASAIDLIDALSALAKAGLTPLQRAELASITLDFDALPVAEIVNILDVAEGIDPSISLAWLDRTEHQDLLERLCTETPFALLLARERAEEGLVVRGDIFEAAVRYADSPNDVLAAHVHAIMRLEPRAARADVRLVDAQGGRSLHLNAENHIARGTAPPKALTQSNRRVLDVVAVEVGSDSWSRYLVRGEEMLGRGLKAFQRLLDSIVVGKVNQQALATLNQVVTGCDDLIAPAEPPRSYAGDLDAPSGRHLTPLQNLLCNVNANVFARVAKLPDGAAALAAHLASLVQHAEDAKREPWSLVRDTPPTNIDTLQLILRDLEVVALEAAASGVSPLQRWRPADRKPKGAFDLVVRGSRRAFLKRIEARTAELLELILRELPGASLVPPTLADGVLWRIRFVGTFPLVKKSDFKRWIAEARSVGERLRAQVENGEDIALVPVLNGRAAIDYTYQLSRANSESIGGSLLRTVGQTSLLTAPDPSLVRRIELPVTTISVELAGLSEALRDLDGIYRLGFGGPERPRVEQQRLDEAVSDLKRCGDHLLKLFNGIDHPSAKALRSFLGGFLASLETGEVVPTPSPEVVQDALLELAWHQSLAPR